MSFAERVVASVHPDGAASSDLPQSRSREPHYSVAEIAKVWKLSRDKVTEIFKREPGVLVLGSSSSLGKHGYRTLRIPESVMDRVHRRLSNPDIIQSRIDKRRP